MLTFLPQSNDFRLPTKCWLALSKQVSWRLPGRHIRLELQDSTEEGRLSKQHETLAGVAEKRAQLFDVVSVDISHHKIPQATISPAFHVERHCGNGAERQKGGFVSSILKNEYRDFVFANAVDEVCAGALRK